MKSIERSLPRLSLMCVSLLFIDFNIHLDSVKDAFFLHFPLKLPYKTVRVLKQFFFTQFFVNNLWNTHVLANTNLEFQGFKTMT